MKPCLRAALAALALTVLPAHAGTLADVQVISRSSGQRLPVYSHGGKLYVAGQPGERYSVQIANRTGRRILAVASVDGINVVSGETASPEQTGYVFSPGQAYEILGWRKNSNEVAAFYFTALPDSYAARTDRPGDVGVIGVAVFREWTPPRPRVQRYPRAEQGPGAAVQDRMNEQGWTNSQIPESPASMAREADRPAAAAPQRREKLGTGHGEREQSAVTFTDFRRETPQPSEVLTIHHDRYENLMARGIVPRSPGIAAPNPFPAGVRFAPDPRS
jgi:hypothetical protein